MNDSNIGGKIGAASESSARAGGGQSDRAGARCEGARHEHPAVRAESASPVALLLFRATGNCKILRWGVDSLYLSYRGELREEWQALLEEARTYSISPNELDQAKAQLSLLDHRFEVVGGGSKLYRYTLRDGAYNIQLSKRRKSNIPVAYVQIRSQFLTAVGVDQAVSQLGMILQALIQRDGEPNVSRVDLFVDFVPAFPLTGDLREALVCRARYFATYHDDEELEGFGIGAGGPIRARLYNKTKETDKKGNHSLKPLWAEAGWIPGEQVFRSEVQFRNEILKELGLRVYSQLAEACGGIWRYATEDWLRLTIPNAEDQTRSRWPTHPLWVELSQIPWNGAQPASRVPVRKDRAPSDDRIFRFMEAAITSYMAVHGITNPVDASDEMLREMQAFADSREFITLENFEGRMKAKAARKAKEFNLPYPNDRPITDEDALERARLAYLKASGG